VNGPQVQVGMMLMGCTIENMVMGGPAYNSYKLDKGDIILKVDGKPVDEDSLLPALIGSDVPGEEMALVHFPGKMSNDSDHACMHACRHVGVPHCEEEIWHKGRQSRYG
jgi:hypothetical protein